jgi:beta-lactamase class A
MISRRKLLVGSLAASVLSTARAAEDPSAALADLERKHGGRLGVAIFDTGKDMRIAHRGQERFAMCSSFKLLVAAFVLARVDRKEENLARRIAYGKDVLISHSPITEKHVGEGMTVGALCEATMIVSDNAAANLLLDSFGGPSALTAYLRSLGDRVTRLDRYETALNDVPPGDPRDTTTPLAMIDTLHKLILGDALSVPSRDQLTTWFIGNKTGDKRLRAGIPQGWKVGDKTGTWTEENNATNDIAVLWPPARPPILVTSYYAHAPGPMDEREAVLAEVGRLAAGL